jgi:TPR repeat protein
VQAQVEGFMDEELDRLRERSEEGDAAAQYELAEWHRIGFAVEQDDTEALALYRISAEQGYVLAQFQLAQMYERGEIVEEDPAKAFDYYRLAAEQGHSDAQYVMAHGFHVGDGVAQDVTAAIVWYRKAAEQGHVGSQLTLGDLYRIGLAVPKDLVQSAEWYRRAAEQGDVFAQYELGNAYRHGKGVDKDVLEAIEWYRLAAEAGNDSAQVALMEAQAELADFVPSSSVVLASESQPAQEDPSAAVSASLKVSSSPSVEADPEQEVDGVVSSNEGDQTATFVENSPLAATPVFSIEDEVQKLLAHAEKQMSHLALTTPEGDSAFDTYHKILILQPDDEAALAGIEQIGVKYVELADLATAKGDLGKASHYAAKASELAPEHPLVQAMANPLEADRPTSEENTLTSATLAHIKMPQRFPADGEEDTADVNDLILWPGRYLDRDVVVTGSLAHFLGLYRLRSEKEQNSLIVNVDGIPLTDQIWLEKATRAAGIFGSVRVRIKGTIEQATFFTYRFVTSDLVLGVGPNSVAIVP